MATLEKQTASGGRAELHHLTPVAFVTALAEAVMTIGKQFPKLPAHALIDLPNREDPVLRSDGRLALLGRSTATEL